MDFCMTYHKSKELKEITDEILKVYREREEPTLAKRRARSENNPLLTSK